LTDLRLSNFRARVAACTQSDPKIIDGFSVTAGMLLALIIAAAFA
jgi:hypothetical protein